MKHVILIALVVLAVSAQNYNGFNGYTGSNYDNDRDNYYGSNGPLIIDPNQPEPADSDMNQFISQQDSIPVPTVDEYTENQNPERNHQRERHHKNEDHDSVEIPSDPEEMRKWMEEHGKDYKHGDHKHCRKGKHHERYSHKWRKEHNEAGFNSSLTEGEEQNSRWSRWHQTRQRGKHHAMKCMLSFLVVGVIGTIAIIMCCKRYKRTRIVTPPMVNNQNQNQQQRLAAPNQGVPMGQPYLYQPQQSAQMPICFNAVNTSGVPHMIVGMPIANNQQQRPQLQVQPVMQQQYMNIAQQQFARVQMPAQVQQQRPQQVQVVEEEERKERKPKEIELEIRRSKYPQLQNQEEAIPMGQQIRPQVPQQQMQQVQQGQQMMGIPMGQAIYAYPYYNYPNK